MELYVQELSYEEGVFDLITKPIEAELLAELREEYKENCVGLSEFVGKMFLRGQILASAICFQSKEKDKILLVQDELTNESVEYKKHSVVLFGDCCADVLHSDRIIPMKEYIETLERLNPSGIRLDATLSFMFDASGMPFKPTIDYLKEYKRQDNPQ